MATTLSPRLMLALGLVCALVVACAPTPAKTSAERPSLQRSHASQRAGTEEVGTSKPVDSDTYTVDFIGADLCAAPSATSAHLALIPEGTVLVPLARDSYFIKVNFQGQSGWVSTAGLERHMAVPSADLDFHHGGYKIVGGEYRYFFGFANRGVQSYTGNIAVRLYSGDTEIPLGGIGATGETAQAYFPNDVSANGYPVNPGDVIEPGRMRGFYLTAHMLATRYVFKTAQGEKSGIIGAQIAN